MTRTANIWTACAGLFAVCVVGAEPPCPAETVANACAASCYAQHNQCRIARKGDSSCDAQLTSCLRGCNARR